MKTESIKTLLIVDDDVALSSSLEDYFKKTNLRIHIAHSASECLKICSQIKPDIILLDQRLPDGDGLSVCSSIIANNDQSKIIFITAYPDFQIAVEAIKAGAYDYLSKPFNLDELDIKIKNILRTKELEQIEQIQKYNIEIEKNDTILIGENGGLQNIMKLIKLSSDTGSNTLITGETGTGKNIIAKKIHYSSPIYLKSFITLNCTALPESLIEAELFGYERGSFTGAYTAKKGIFEMAQSGTLLLDEIGEMPVHLQAKILGVIEERKIRRIGAENFKDISLRLIATTNRELEDELANKSFRKDLYYRLSVIRIHLPPLRERKDDIPELVRHFCRKLNPAQTMKIPESEIKILIEYPWPGNIRELRNVIERYILLRRETDIRITDLLYSTIQPHKKIAEMETSESLPLQEMENRYIEKMLIRHGNNLTHTAAALGISISTLKRKIKTFNLAKRI